MPKVSFRPLDESKVDRIWKYLMTEERASVDQSDLERPIRDAMNVIVDCLLNFDDDVRARILRTVATFYQLQNRLSEPTSHSPIKPLHAEQPRLSDRATISPKDFLFQKMPKTDVERVACLAYYLAHFRGQPHFKTNDISDLNTEAAQLKFSNASYSLTNAIQSGLIAVAAKGLRQLSALGERYVDALPDYSAARTVMDGQRRRRSKKSNKPKE